MSIGSVVLVLLVAGAVFAALNPFDFGHGAATPAATAKSAKPTAPPTISATPPPVTQVCPDAGSIRAGTGDNKTVQVVVTGASQNSLLLLGPGRHVVVKSGARQIGSVTICGDGGTVLVQGKVDGPVVLAGGGSKIVLDVATGAVLPRQYVASKVAFCTSKAGDVSRPSCDNYILRPTPAPTKSHR